MSTRRSGLGILVIAVIALLAVPSISSASLIQLAVPGPDTNNAVQAATRILELQDNGTESGCVVWNGVADALTCTAGFTGGDEKPQTQTRTLGALGITSGSDLRIAFDAIEPAGDDISLDALRLLILNPLTGATIFSADLAGPIALGTTRQGNGESDLLLALDAAQAAAFDLAVAPFGLVDLRVGLSANLSGSGGGFEGFYVGDTATLGVGDIDVPEPGALLLMGAGLSLVALRFRRKA
jgi:hypothetical protein